MKWDDTSNSLCPVAQTSAILGDRWTLLILREAFLGARRFDEFQRVLGISPHLLSTRLKRLVSEEIFQHDGKKRSEYRLTKSGKALQPVLLLITKWGNDWRAGDKRQVTHIHKACQQHFEPVVLCSSCHEPVGLNVETVLKDDLVKERREQAALNSRRKEENASK